MKFMLSTGPAGLGDLATKHRALDRLRAAGEFTIDEQAGTAGPNENWEWIVIGWLAAEFGKVQLHELMKQAGAPMRERVELLLRQLGSEASEWCAVFRDLAMEARPSQHVSIGVDPAKAAWHKRNICIEMSYGEDREHACDQAMWIAFWLFGPIKEYVDHISQLPDVVWQENRDLSIKITPEEHGASVQWRRNTALERPVTVKMHFRFPYAHPGI